MHDRYELVEKVSNIARVAGLEIMKVYNTANKFKIDVYTKTDLSPVTNADLCAHKIIVHFLQKLTPNVPIISEEYLPEWKKCVEWDYFWLVDPLDGTKEFLSRNGEFTVNIAFIADGEPIIGVVYAPAYDILYASNNIQSWKIDNKGNRLKIATRLSNNPTVVISRSHSIDHPQQLKNYLINMKNYTILRIGSSLKFCLIAEGTAQFYPRFSATRIWDTAAGHVIAKSAGALINDWNGNALNYRNFNQLFMNDGFQVLLG